MEKILLVNVNWLGDVLFSTAVIRALKNAYPDSFLACMVPARCREILEGNPYLDEIIIFDERSSHRSIFRKIRFVLDLKKKKFTKAFILHRSLTRALIVFLAGISERVGYDTKKRGIFLTHKISLPDSNIHRTDHYLNVIKSYGIEVKDNKYEFFISQEDKKFAQDILKNNNITDNDFSIAINPGGNWRPKRWIKDNYVELADALLKKFNAKIILTGAKKDIPLVDDIKMSMQGTPLVLAGKTTLKQLAAVMQSVNLVISADSGPMHIASAMGVNIIALFGPTLPSITGPLGEGKSIILQKSTECKLPCYDLKCVDYRCMKAITVDDVLDYVDEFRK